MDECEPSERLVARLSLNAESDSYFLSQECTGTAGALLFDSGSHDETWPSLLSLCLTHEKRKARLLGIGGSDANTILSGDHERIRRLWREKRGAPAEDLSDRLPVALGSWTESFNRQWFEKVTGEVVGRIGEAFVSAAHSWRRCTLDGLIARRNAVWEAKHSNAFTKPEEVLERYMPQLQHNMAVVGANHAVLSVIFGNHKFEIFEVESDWLYQRELFDAEQAFWTCVKDGTEPVPVVAPDPPKQMGVREVCMEGRNGWAAAASDWLANKEAAKAHTAACVQIKDFIEPDMARAFGHGIEAKRSKAGAITIKETAQ